VDAASDSALQSALAYCLTEEAREQARACAQRAARRVEELRRSFIAALREPSPLDAPWAHRAAAGVSIIIRDLGNETWLSEALASVRAQRHPALETIVVAYSPRPAVAPEEAGVRRITVATERSGDAAAAARDAGAAASRGAFLLFLDSDERLSPLALQTGLNCFHLYPESGFVYGRCRDISDDGLARERYIPPPQEDTYAAALAGHPLDGPAILYRREALEAAGRFGGASGAGSHHGMCLRIAAARPARGFADTIAERRVHDGSACLRAGDTLSANLEILESQWPLVQDHPVRGRLIGQGLRRARVTARTPVLQHARASLGAGHWLAAARSLTHLIAYLPAWLRSFTLQLRMRPRP
jgi:hypothetical protein